MRHSDNVIESLLSRCGAGEPRQLCPQPEAHKKPLAATENWQGWERICNNKVWTVCVPFKNEKLTA